MKIGVISDTHRNIDLMDSAVNWLINKHHIAAVYHLGDDYDDAAALQEYYIETVQVPGIYDPRYKNGELKAVEFQNIVGLTIMLVHALDKDASDSDIQKSDIILHGHTHHEELRLDDGKLFMNPGHLKGPLDKNMPPTFGLLSILDREVQATIFNIDFKIVRNLQLIRSESGLYKSS